MRLVWKVTLYTLLICSSLVVINNYYSDSRKPNTSQFPLKISAKGALGNQHFSEEFIVFPDIDNLSPAEFWQFIKFKEDQYEERRGKIRNFCNTAQMEDVLREPKANSIVFDPIHKLAYCQIAKTGSSTWCMHFLTLANASEAFKSKYKMALQLAAPLLWPLPKHDNFSLQMAPMTSFLFVRHPFARLVSVYVEKLVLHDNPSWKDFGQSIIAIYRSQAPIEGHFNISLKNTPVPSEFLQFVISNVQLGPLKANQHWSVQVFSCPLCSADFKIVGKMEEMDADTAYIRHKADVTQLIDPYLHKNPSSNLATSATKNDWSFWANIDEHLILDAFHAYKLDFDTFQYDPITYLEEIGLSQKALVLRDLILKEEA